MLQDYYQKTSNKKKLLIKLGIMYGLFITITYTIFRAYYINFDPSLAIFSVILFLAELHTIFLMIGFLYSIWPRDYKKYEKENNRKDLQVNLFITVVGEPIEIFKETVEHAVKAANFYNKKVNPKNVARVIVLNDGKGAKKDTWTQVRDISKELGVLHVARETNEGYKAGNINNGIKTFPADDPQNTIDCFFDADFCAKENFLIEILKPLIDDEVDFVQSPQRYKNLNTWVAKAAGAHQIFFFDYICPAKAHDNALFLCGTNYAIRRKALLSAGGVDNRFVTEDYATSIRLHLNGNKGVFIPNVLAEGLAPMNLKEYFNQQKRWCKGCLDANSKYMKELLFGPLTLRQKFHYFLTTVYYFIGVRDMILILAPIPFLFFGVTLIRANTSIYLALVYLPMLIFNFSLFFMTFRDPVKSLVLDVVTFPVFAGAFLSSVIGKNLPFSITVKKYEKENPFRVYKLQLTVAAMLISGLIFSTLTKTAYNPYGKFINHFWAAYSASFLSLGFLMVIRENYDLALKVSIQLEGFINPMKKYAYNFAKYATVVSATFAFGMIVPISYDRFKNTSIEEVNESITTKAEDIQNYNKIKELIVPSRGIYYGYYFEQLNKHPEKPVVKMLESESPTLTMFYEDFNREHGFDGVYLKRLSDKGVIPIITWEPWDVEDPDSIINKPGKPQKLILEGKYDDHIRSFAMGVSQYKEPVFIRFAHEMNGNWYPWGDHDGNSENYKKMWRHVHKIFEEEGADNAIWVWAPNNTDQFGKTDSVLSFYPGDNYVDWVGYSAFNWGAANHYGVIWHDFEYISFEIYSKLSQINKPIMVAETSSASKGGDKTGWFYNALSTYIPQMSRIKAVVIFNQNINDADFSLMSDMDYPDVIEKNIINNDHYLKKPVLIYY